MTETYLHAIIDADDVVWNIDVTGSDNNFTTLQKDGGEQAIKYRLHRRLLVTLTLTR